MNRNDKVHAVIHSSAVLAGSVGAGLAQLPGSDAAVIVPIQTSMIVAIALAHGRRISEGTATSVLATSAATIAGRGISQVLVGWVPVLGNALNAITAVGITEAIGWSADAYFENLSDGRAPDGWPLER